MAETRTNSSRVAGRYEPATVFVLALCVIAAIRLLVFSAAFPFFTNVDEPSHFDLICKHAHGHIPRAGQTGYEPEAARYARLTGTWEYMCPRSDSSLAAAPPVWRLPPQIQSECLAGAMMGGPNHEAFSPPVYYLLEALCFRAFAPSNWREVHFLYALRFFHLVFYVPLLWVSYRLCKRFCPNDPFLAAGVPLLLAFFPQDSFYSLNSDAASPLAGALALYSLLAFSTNREAPAPACLVAGLMASLAFLVKISNWPFLLAFAALAAFRARDLSKRRLAGRLPGLLAAAAISVTPVALWLVWNKYAAGDWTGTAEKARHLGWTRKAASEIWRHPIFTPAGMARFYHELMTTFWRGEIVWRLEAIRNVGLDWFYSISSLVFLAAGAYGLRSSRAAADGGDSSERATVRLALGVTLASIGFLAGLSTLYDFGDCWYPSRDHPFFTSGRLISGALVPFALIYLRGFRQVLAKCAPRLDPILALSLLVVAITASEIAASLDVFHSAFNWYHSW